MVLENETISGPKNNWRSTKYVFLGKLSIKNIIFQGDIYAKVFFVKSSPPPVFFVKSSSSKISKNTANISRRYILKDGPRAPI